MAGTFLFSTLERDFFDFLAEGFSKGSKPWIGPWVDDDALIELAGGVSSLIIFLCSTYLQPAPKFWISFLPSFLACSSSRALTTTLCCAAAVPGCLNRISYLLRPSSSITNPSIQS